MNPPRQRRRKTPPICNGCGRATPLRSGYCSKCWGKPHKRYLPHAEPTPVGPGSEKVAVLVQRYRRSRELFHPEDSPLTEVNLD